MKRPGMKRHFKFPLRTREAVRADVEEEFQFHLDMRTEALVRSGLPAGEARARALQEFGNSESGAAVCAGHGDRIERRRRVAQLLGELRQDMLLGVRLMARNPWHSAAAVLTLAIAIGGNTAVFSLANAFVFKPLPVQAPHELARVRPGESQISWLNYRDIAERNRVFSDMAAHRRIVAGLADGGTPVRFWGEQTTANYFSVLGVAAAIGRTYMPFDTRRDLVVLAHHAWQARFGADPDVAGRLVVLNGRSYEVIGVMPAGFRGVAPAGLVHDFWIAVDDRAPNGMLRDRGAPRFEAFGRLVQGTSHARAEAALQVLGRQIRADHPGLPETFPLMEVLPVDGIAAFRGMADLIVPVLGFVTLMGAAAALVLLIGCANIGGLLLGRAAARRKEIAVRLALGAGRGRLVRQLLTESFVLAIAGGAAGLLLATWLTTAVNPFLSRVPVPMAFDLQLDRRVLAYALGISAMAALVFGLAPARRAARFDVVSSLKDDAGAASVVRQRARRTLVAGQVAMCTVLLVWSGLFLRSLGKIGDIDPGFDAHGVLLARIEVDEAAHDRESGERLFLDLEEHVQSSPGVAAAGIATVVPLSLENEEFDVVRDPDPGSSGSPVRCRVVANRLTPGWFATVRIPLRAGRDFTANDRRGAPPVAIVNETLARQFWDGDAVGRRVRIPGQPDTTAEVVGIVRDSKYWTLGEEVAPTIYLPFRQAYARWMTLHARTDQPRGTMQAIAGFVRSRSPDTFVDVRPMADTLATAMVPARVGAWVTASFAAIAMSLSALGVYALVAFSVAQRTREIGVRKAVGAGTWDVVRLIVGENMLLALTGLAGGLLGGVLGANVLRAFIAGVSPADPVTLLASAMVVCAAAAMATAFPAARAARVNPLIVFRDT